MRNWRGGKHEANKVCAKKVEWWCGANLKPSYRGKTISTVLVIEMFSEQNCLQTCFPFVRWSGLSLVTDCPTSDTGRIVDWLSFSRRVYKLSSSNLSVKQVRKRLLIKHKRRNKSKSNYREDGRRLRRPMYKTSPSLETQQKPTLFGWWTFEMCKKAAKERARESTVKKLLGPRHPSVTVRSRTRILLSSSSICVCSSTVHVSLAPQLGFRWRAFVKHSIVDIWLQEQEMRQAPNTTLVILPAAHGGRTRCHGYQRYWRGVQSDPTYVRNVTAHSA